MGRTQGPSSFFLSEVQHACLGSWSGDGVPCLSARHDDAVAHYAVRERFSDALDGHIDGIGRGERMLRQSGQLSPRLCAKALRVDPTFAMVRHIARHL